jgi:protein involved in ribonucleotide reduction
LIVYFSNTSGFTDKFVRKLGLPAERIPLMTADAASYVAPAEFVLIVPTYGANGRDYVPKQVIKFLNRPENRGRLRGVIAAGNRNFLEDYARAGDIIAAKCNVPMLYRFELDGTTDDVDNIQKGLKLFWETK